MADSATYLWTIAGKKENTPMAEHRVLLIIEDSSTLDRVGAHMAEQGFDVRCASNADEALALDQNWNVELMVLEHSFMRQPALKNGGGDEEEALIDTLRARFSSA